MDDIAIIELYFARDERAIKATEEKYGGLCRSISYNILNNEEDAKECVNDVYLGVWNAIPPMRPNCLKAFVCKVARNLSLKKYEFLSREKRSAALTVSFSELEQVLSDDAASISEERIGELISRFLHTQEKEVRQIFVRKYYFFESVEDIAKRYSYSQSKVKSILYRTRNKLKEYLSKEGIGV